MSRKCEHDWFDHYMMYNMMSNGGGKGSGDCLLPNFVAETKRKD